MVTIYNGNLGLVKDVREVRLEAGIGEVQFMDVAAQIDPTTVHLKSLTDAAGLKVLEQNYEYDLLSSQKLHREVRRPEGADLRRATARIHEATLLSTNGPVFEINGQIHLGHSGRHRAARPCPRTSSPSPRSCGSCGTSSTALQRVEASYLTGGITLEGGLRDGDQRRATRAPTSPAG